MCLVAVSGNAFVIQHKFLNFALVTYPKHEAKKRDNRYEDVGIKAELMI